VASTVRSEKGPRGHIFTGSKAPWFEITDSLPYGRRACVTGASLRSWLASPAAAHRARPRTNSCIVDTAEADAEERDASALRALVADDYEDSSGRDAAEIRNLLHAFLVAHPSLSLITRIDSIELEGTELARVQVTVGVLGREANAESDWNLAAEVRRLDVRLAREDGGEWRVIRAGPQVER
jgi:hypothetical protein